MDIQCNKRYDKNDHDNICCIQVKYMNMMTYAYVRCCISYEKKTCFLFTQYFL